MPEAREWDGEKGKGGKPPVIKNSHWDIMHSVRKIVDVIIITLYGDKWSLGLLW